MSRPAHRSYTLQPARIAVANGDEAGVILRVDDRVVAIVIRLESSYYGEDRGRWYLEAAFGAGFGQVPPTFARLSEGLVWIAKQLGHPAGDLAEVLARAEDIAGAEDLAGAEDRAGRGQENVIPFPRP